MNYQALLDRSEDWLKYAIHLNLLHGPKEKLKDLRKNVLRDEKIKSCLKDICEFHNMPVLSHKNPDLPMHKLLFLLDLGLDTDVPEIEIAIRAILKNRDEHGVCQSVVNIPRHFGGTGEDAFSWCLCDAPILFTILIKAGIDYEQIRTGTEYLASLCRDNGFLCCVSSELGRFRGPGKKEDCCPYATLLMANLLAEIPSYRSSDIATSAVNVLLDLWENSMTQHPYLFYMGTDFRKLKAPSCWYDLISVADAVSKYPFAHRDKRFSEMIDLIKSKQDGEGFFTPESIYLKYRAWDFGQKKCPSPYLTYLCYKIFDRIG
ncbi:MAG TPA: hypothetical protein PK854_10930 [Oscillospiraceae bacterium]|nr:hypothetical protein [Oscillospiraceae bacterium]HPS35765.1 hypothetical protein [Oscillospiraceae bacterium]